jgi:sarcosine oxidase subunit delta
MKLINCPLNGPRNAQEFICGGEVKTTPSHYDANVRDWADYIFMENNPRGVIREWWCHVASGYWFIAERNTISDTFISTYPVDESDNHPAFPGFDSDGDTHSGDDP